MRLLGIVIFTVGGLGIAYPLWWGYRSQMVGDALIHKAQAAIDKSGNPPPNEELNQPLPQATLTTTPATDCASGDPSSGIGLLKIPAISLVAPVEQGTTDSVLSVAVGHDRSSAWPGIGTTSVLSAHDVSWFTNIDNLQPGDAVYYETPGCTFSYVVTGSQIVKKGFHLGYITGGGLILDTCWPTNALWVTSKRYFVIAHFVSSSAPSPQLPQSWWNHPKTYDVPAPQALRNMGLGLAHNSIPMGTLTIGGLPDTFISQSPLPINAQLGAVDLWSAVLDTLRMQNQSWWSKIAPNVQMPETLLGTRLADYYGKVNVTVYVNGATIVFVKLNATVGIVPEDQTPPAGIDSTKANGGKALNPPTDNSEVNNPYEVLTMVGYITPNNLVELVAIRTRPYV